jgi:CTP:molybdopterin cytidylyltransferase MocA
MTVAAVVLAAGEASRFGSPKQRLLLPGVLERLAETTVDEIVVVEGAYSLQESVNAEVASDTVSQGVRIARCEEWQRGPGASLRCGLAALGNDVEAAVIVLADGPNLAPAAVERVVAEWRRTGGIVGASYLGSRGHPLVLGRSEWSNVPDEGLRDLPVRLVPCDDLGDPGDVDTPEDLLAP